MKPLNLFPSIIFTILVLVASSVVASTLKDAKEAEENKEAINQQSLTIELGGIRSSKGRVLVMVFDNSAAFNSFDHNNSVGYQQVSAKGDGLTFNFLSLTEGPYAVFVMHDENNDYQLNERDGYPIEGFAVSGAKNKYDEPSFKQAAVVKGKHHMKLVYF